MIACSCPPPATQPPEGWAGTRAPRGHNKATIGPSQAFTPGHRQRGQRPAPRRPAALSRAGSALPAGHPDAWDQEEAHRRRAGERDHPHRAIRSRPSHLAAMARDHRPGPRSSAVPGRPWPGPASQITRW